MNNLLRQSFKYLNWVALAMLIFSCSQNNAKVTPEEARQIAKEAYIYGFPLMVNYKTMYFYAINENSPEYKGEFNEMSCEARLFTPEDKAVVTPNSDTPYCMFWVDLRNEPQILSLPKVETERYYSFQLIDLYTHNFAYLGTLTTGNDGGNYLVAIREWGGKIPDKINDLIRCETDIFFVVVRTQLMDEDDMENVRQIQDNYKIQSLSAYLGEEPSQSIAEGVKEGFAEIEDFIDNYAADPLNSARIFGTRDFLTKSARENYQLDDFYILRAVAAQTGLYGNSGFEAMYPSYLAESQGVPYNAAGNNYTITFEKDQLPPVKAFWSLSMYDGQTQLFIHNELERYLLNSNNMDKFKFNKDGSLTLYIQKDSPGKEMEPNWLPAPDGPFYCVMRLYGPWEEALSGEWTNPPLVKHETGE